MIYNFECECGAEFETVNIPIKDGPPKEVVCINCGEKMSQVFGGNFVLKGDWPGKLLKKRSYDSGAAKERNDQQFEDDKRNDRIVEECLETRRKGRKAVEQEKAKNPQKWKDYADATKKGHRAKKKK